MNPAPDEPPAEGRLTEIVVVPHSAEAHVLWSPRPWYDGILVITTASPRKPSPSIVTSRKTSLYALVIAGIGTSC